MKLKILFFILLFQNISGQHQAKDYYQFLNGRHRHPIDYIFENFEHSDIIILVERDHRDTAQYDLISDIIRDDRFKYRICPYRSGCGQSNRMVKSCSKRKF